MDEQDKGTWQDFPSGTVKDGKGGDATLHIVFSTGEHEIRARVDDALVQHL